MAYSQDIKNKVRANYIKGMTLKASAMALGVPSETVRGWKRRAGDQGDDWDYARSARKMTAGGIQDLTGNVLEEFAEMFTSTIDAIKTAENLTALQKAQTLAQLSDAFQKTVKAVGDSNPKLSKLAVAMDVLQRQGEFIRNNHPTMFEPFAAMLEDFGRELATVYA